MAENLREDQSLRIALVTVVAFVLPDLWSDSIRETIIHATPNLIGQNLTKKEIENAGKLMKIIYLLQLEVQDCEQQFNWETFQKINDPLDGLSLKEKTILIRESLIEAFSMDLPRKKAKLAMLIFLVVGLLLENPGITSTPMFAGLLLQISMLLKEGKLSKSLVKQLLKILMARGEPIPQELLDLVES